MRSWCTLTDHFYEDTGINIDIRDVWGAPHPIIAFISNRQTCDVTMDQHQAIEDLLEDMGINKEDGPMWYLDKRELVCVRYIHLLRESQQLMSSLVLIL